VPPEQPRSANPFLELLRYWGPVLRWGLIIWSVSTRAFSESHTSRLIVPLLHWLFPFASQGTLLRAHHLIRKSSHFIEYFIFSLFLFSGIRRGRSGWRLCWAVTTLVLAACWAASDELHQVFVPNRGPSPFDVLLDTAGAAAALVFTWCQYRPIRTSWSQFRTLDSILSWRGHFRLGGV